LFVPQFHFNNFDCYTNTQRNNRLDQTLYYQTGLNEIRTGAYLIDTTDNSQQLKIISDIFFTLEICQIVVTIDRFVKCIFVVSLVEWSHLLNSFQAKCIADTSF
jgi:hypothetical protein